MRFMGVDMGTSGCKAVVFDENWNVVCQAYREYPMSFPGEGLLELDAERVWREICQVIREANSKAAGEIAALAVSAIGDVIIPVDEKNNSVRCSIVDFDPRGGDEIRNFSEEFGKYSFYQTNGMPPLYLGSLAKILWIRDHEPEVYKKAARWATYEDFIIAKLGLPPVASYSEVSRTMLFDIRKKDWAEDILNKIPLTREMLPIPRPSGTVIGHLPKEMADNLGFKGEVQVVTGGHDMICAAVGAGLDEEQPGTAIDIAGTIEGLVAAMPAANTCPVMLENLFPCYPGFSGYVTFSVNLTAGCVVRWYRNQVAPEEYEWCKENKINFYEYMQREMNPDRPGKLNVLPHFSGSGNPFFQANGVGAMYGLNLDTTREDIARAIVEGLAYELRLHLEAYAQAGIHLDTIRSVGGGATIDRQLQLKANITGLRVVKGAVAEASALGAAAYAAVGAGALSNPAEAYQKVKQKEIVFYPNQEARRRFGQQFEIYRKLAYSINELDAFRELREIEALYQ